MNGISVIVCCYNSASRLPLALAYLSKQKANKDINWEVIIVNNNSTDDTVGVAKQIWKSYAGGKELKIVDESEPGLSYARQTGVKAALYDIIIFCDDDNLLAENYLQHAYDLVNRTKEAQYGIWGGKTVAYFDTHIKEPEWFEKEKANYVVGPQGSKTGDISSRGYVWGAGMVILKALYGKLINEGFPLLLVGRQANTLLAGDDSELCLRSLILGYKLYYDQELVLEHYIPKEKLTPAYNEGLKKGFAVSNEILNKYTVYLHYVSGKAWIRRYYYTVVFALKYIFHTIGIRSLTTYDTLVLQALGSNKKFRDSDFELMRGLLKLRTKHLS